MIKYLTRLGRWFWVGRYFWFCVFIVVVTFSRVFNTIDDLKIFGFLLNLYGTVSIILSFSLKIKLLNIPGYWKSILSYIKSFPTKPKKRNIVAHAASGSLMYTGLEARLIVKPIEGDINANIKFLHDKIDEVFDTVDKVKIELKKSLQALEQEIIQLKEETTKQHRETKKFIIEASSPSLGFDTFNVFCLAWGLAITTFPEMWDKYF